MKMYMEIKVLRRCNQSAIDNYVLIFISNGLALLTCLARNSYVNEKQLLFIKVCYDYD